MKLLRTTIVFLLSVFLLSGATALAAEQWTTDPAKGSKICIIFYGDNVMLVSASWSGPEAGGLADGQGTLQFVYKDKAGKETKVQADAEMKAGKLDGKVSMKWSDGDAFDGIYKNGLRESGTFRWAGGLSYEGEWKNGQPTGYGIGRNSEGKIYFEGQWQDGKPMTPLKTETVLGIPWGAAEDEGRRIMLERPKTTRYSGGKDAAKSWQIYVSTYNGEPSRVEVFYYQQKMYQVGVQVYADADQVLDTFNTVKKGLTDRYGAPYAENGNYLDTQVFWALGGGYIAMIRVGKHSVPSSPGLSQYPWRLPFAVTILYTHVTTSEMINKEGGVGKDY